MCRAARDTLVLMDVFPRTCAAISAALLSRSWRCWPREPAFPRDQKRRFCAALPGERHCDKWCHFHDRIYHALLKREVAVFSSSSQFLKMSKQSPLESFDTKLFINEIAQLQAIWDSRPEGDLAVRQTTSVTCENA